MDHNAQPAAQSARTFASRVRGVLGSTALLLLGLTIVPVALEIAVRFDLVPVGPVLWYRPADKAADTRIDAVNNAFAQTTPFLFNAPVTAPPLPPGKRKRIAVIGDSIVWGSGFALGEAWPFKLSQLIAAAHPDIEVISWGHNGWSTKQELDFLKAAADQFDLFHVDGIMVGFATNDPDIVSLGQQRFLKFDDPVSKIIARFLPNAFAFATAYGGAIYGKYLDPELGYAHWEDSLYEPANLALYEDVLREMKALADAHGAWLTFLLTPSFPYTPYFDQKFTTIGAMLDKAGIPYVNPLARVVSEFGKLPGAPFYRQLWANRGNAHPGPQLTAAYGAAAFTFLEHGGFFDRAVPAVPTAVAAKDCDAGSAVVSATANTYTLLGASYVRLRGNVPRDGATALSADDAQIVAEGQSFPVLMLPAGQVRLPEATLSYPANSFWVDLPADHAKGPLRLALHDVDGCRVNVTIAPPFGAP